MLQGLKKQESVNVDSSPDMDSYEVISGKSNPSSPSIEDLGAVGGGLYDGMTPENDLSRDSAQGAASFDPNLNVKAGQDFNEMEGTKRDFDAEEDEDEQEEEVQLGNDDDDDAEYDGSDGTDDDKVESDDDEDNIEVTLQDNLENSDDEEHPDLRKRLPPNSKKKADQ